MSTKIGQTKLESFIEIVAKKVVSIFVATCGQIFIFPYFDIPEMSIPSHVLLSSFFIVISMVNGYFLRRFFNYLMIRRIKNERNES